MHCPLSSCGIPLTPHKLVKVWRNLMSMTSLHGLQLELNPVPIWLHMLGVDSRDRINEVQWVIHCVVRIDCWQPCNPTISSPHVWMNDTSRCNMCSNYRQQCSSISGLNDLHITQRRSLHIHIHNAEHPHITAWPSTTVMLNIKIVKIPEVWILWITLGLCRNCDSSTCTIIPGPPRTICVCNNLVGQTSRSHWYTWHAVFAEVSASVAAFNTGYSFAHQTINITLLKRKPGPCEETVNPNWFCGLGALAIPAYAIWSGLIPFSFSHLLTTSVYGTDLAI